MAFPSSVSRTSGVAGSFYVTLNTLPAGNAPTITIYSNSARTTVAVATTVLAPTANPVVWVASYPATLAAGTYYLAVSAVYTTGQPAIVDTDDTLILSVPSVVVDALLDVLTLSEGHQAINISGGTTSRDTELAFHITAVSRILDRECGPVVQRTVTDELLDGGGYAVYLRLWPVSSVTTVTEYSSGTATVLTAETVTSLPSTGYVAEPHIQDPGLLSGRLIRRSNGSDTSFPTGRRNVKVTYVAGRYANTAAVDARFKMCAASILRRLWKRESGTWAQSPAFFEGVDAQASDIGFFRVAKPMIDEMLSDERQTFIGIA